MSADLFAEFGMGSAPPPSQREPQQQSAGFHSTSLIPDLDAFEESSIGSLSNRYKSATNPAQLDDDWNDSALKVSDTPVLPQYGHGTDVLFDATLESFPDDESDDWGEFESADVPATKPSSNAGLQPKKVLNESKPTPIAKKPAPSDLLGSLSLSDDIPPTSERKPSANQVVPRARKEKLTSLKPALSVQEDPFEEWGDFVDGPSTVPSQGSALNTTAPVSRAPRKEVQSSNSMVGSSGTTSSFPTSSHPATAAQVRPTNIPPPSVLLELFPRLLDELRQDATNARKDMHHKERLEDTATLVICTLKTATRVVAGRSLRWKRDSILSQSMRIGPARSGKSGGMKLNTVNKNEDIKEKQQAVDVLSMWRDRTAIFNSVVQATKRQPVQVVQENTRVMTLPASQGALKAPHACALCGLKRDERLPKIDEHVEDSFGEWWTDHWGHTDCRQFWERHRGLLGQR
ncbi:hypothetical protein AbraIFM66951_011969 [Aspergillus brasiliensis]|uniref:Serine/threonine-protein kinase ppk6 n=1 Tax=Aspergillus brasiliensis TaxID=319629 RepID=A0A9W5YYW4_9EURO|nr:hypothetical protein AbraCBS73388_002020 [Aspergillus brasiliensis]GKZ48209.1 hypothetical protein AbraIFM66951_011969 [Aspergillus brasiliensis]